MACHVCPRTVFPPLLWLNRPFSTLTHCQCQHRPSLPAYPPHQLHYHQQQTHLLLNFHPLLLMCLLRYIFMSSSYYRAIGRMQIASKSPLSCRSKLPSALERQGPMFVVLAELKLRHCVRRSGWQPPPRHPPPIIALHFIMHVLCWCQLNCCRLADRLKQLKWESGTDWLWVCCCFFSCQ